MLLQGKLPLDLCVHVSLGMTRNQSGISVPALDDQGSVRKV